MHSSFKINPTSKRNFRRILPFGLIWLINGIVFLLVELFAMSNQETTLDSAISLDLKIFVFATIAVTGVGLFIGGLELLFINKLFEKRSFKEKLFYKLVFYIVILSVIIFIMFMIAASIELQLSIFNSKVWDKYVTFFFSVTHLSTIMQISFSLVVSLIYAEISENLGQNVLYNFFTGKYHKPRTEERVFMFTDMKSSTEIAEKIGNKKYFEFIRAYYQDLSNAIINHYGEVYQYIGDEIVISWNTKKESAIKHSIDCFFVMQKDLLNKREWYTKHFGIFPEFKAAIHCGKVMTGEIGALKKEIFFTGDVLNTTARVQGLCKLYNSDILITEQVVKRLKGQSNYIIKKLGKTTLKGKSKSIKLFKVVANS